MARHVAAIMLFGLACIADAQSRPCTQADSQHAMSEADGMRSWDALYKSFKNYRQCDDGAIGEGYSESVARILVDAWPSLPRFFRLSASNSTFRRFVFRHIDSTLNPEDLKKIAENATGKCPKDMGMVCDDIARQAEVALRSSD